MKNLVGGFMNKMGMQTDGCNRPGKGFGCGKYKLQRAIIVSNPQEVLQCQPGCVVIHDIEMKNNTSWGWKEGCTLGLDSSIEQVNLPIEAVNIPVDQKVEGMSNIKMSVPFTIKENAMPGDVQEIKIRFKGPKGNVFGDSIPVKIQVIAPEKKEEIVKAEEPKKDEPVKAQEPVKLSHLELVKLAVKLFDSEKLGQTFNECLEVVTLVNGDEELAKKCLQPR